MFRLLTVFAAANGANFVSALRLHGGNKNRRVHVALDKCQMFSRTGDRNGLPTLSTNRSSVPSLPSTGRTLTGRTDLMNQCRVFSRTGDSDFFTSTASKKSSSRGSATSRDRNNECQVFSRENDRKNGMLSTARTMGRSDATTSHDSNRNCQVFSREGDKHNGMLPNTGRITPVPSAPTSRGSGCSSRRSGASLRGCKVFSRTGEPNGLPVVTERSGSKTHLAQERMSTERDICRVAGVFAREGQKGDKRIGMQTARFPVITEV